MSCLSKYATARSASSGQGVRILLSDGPPFDAHQTDGNQRLGVAQTQLFSADFSITDGMRSDQPDSRPLPARAAPFWRARIVDDRERLRLFSAMARCRAPKPRMDLDTFRDFHALSQHRWACDRLCRF